MPQITFLFSAALIALGIATWVAAGQTSATALIPAFFGVPLGIAGAFALREGWRKHAMHVAAAIALIGALGALSRAIPGLGGDGPVRLATWSQLAMGVALIVYVALCVRSFIQARRAGQLG
ncbi:MAG: hypothetical protein AAGC71_13695 [Pseudomonadota bacterium]